MSLLDKFDIRRYDPSLWEPLRAFLEKEYSPKVAVLDSELFHWQYRGFGPKASAYQSRIIFLGNQLVGFLGAIPGTYRWNDTSFEGAAVALWVSAEKVRNFGLGMLLLDHLSLEFPAVVCLRGNEVTRRNMEGRGCRYLPQLHRYVLGVSPEAKSLLVNGSLPTFSARQDSPSFQITPVDANALATQWRGTQADRVGIVSLDRSEAFWQWRYADSKGFRYQQIQVPGAGFAVVRCEKTALPGAPSVMRLIELLPDSGKASSLLQGIWAAAKKAGAILLEFQVAGEWHASALKHFGFQDASETQSFSLYTTFDPLAVKSPINLLYRFPGIPETADLGFLKSDGDMDRPVDLPALQALRRELSACPESGG